MYWQQVLRFAADRACAQWRFFLRTLYLISGDEIRTEFADGTEAQFVSCLADAEAFDSPTIALWRQRTLELMKHPETFDYDEWCGGGFAFAEC